MLHGLANELDAEPVAAVLRQDVHVGEIGKRVPVRERPCEADLLAAVVEADDACRSMNEVLDDVARAAFRPVRLLGEVAVDGVDVDAREIVVELVAGRAAPASSGRSVSQNRLFRTPPVPGTEL